jgi:hypothetical protein
MSGPLAALLLLGAAYLVLAGLWAPDALKRPSVLIVPVVLVIAGAWLMARPAAPLEAATTLSTLRREPYGLLDHRGGDRPAALLLLAWPLSWAIGEASAVAAVTLAAVGVTALLVWALARADAADPRRAVAAQVAFGVLAVAIGGLRDGRVALLFGQAGAALLLVHLARRLGVLDGARDAAAASMFFFVALGMDAAGVGALALLTALLSLGEAAHGDWRRALRLLGAFGVAAALALAIRYAAGLSPLAFPEAPVTRAVPALVVLGVAVAGLAVLGTAGQPSARVMRTAFLTTTVLALIALTGGTGEDRGRASYLAVPLAVAATRPWRPRSPRTPHVPPRSPSAAS